MQQVHNEQRPDIDLLFPQNLLKFVLLENYHPFQGNHRIDLNVLANLIFERLVHDVPGHPLFLFRLEEVLLHRLHCQNGSNHLVLILLQPQRLFL